MASRTASDARDPIGRRPMSLEVIRASYAECADWADRLDWLERRLTGRYRCRLFGDAEGRVFDVVCGRARTSRTCRRRSSWSAPTSAPRCSRKRTIGSRSSTSAGGSGRIRYGTVSAEADRSPSTTTAWGSMTQLPSRLRRSHTPLPARYPITARRVGSVVYSRSARTGPRAAPGIAETPTALPWRSGVPFLSSEANTTRRLPSAG